MAQWLLGGPGGNDSYDVSLVYGFNLPMQIKNNIAVCPDVAGCSVNLGEYFHWLGYIIVFINCLLSSTAMPGSIADI